MSTLWRTPSGWRTAVLLLALWLAGCASFSPEPLPEWPAPQSIRTQDQSGVTVSAGILSDAQARSLYGVNLANAGLQAIWLRIENRSPHGYWLLVSALDADYYAPDEAAALFQPILGSADDERITAHFRALAVPLKTRAGETSEGFVLAPRHEGGRYVSAPLLGSAGLLTFGFALPLPDGEFDYERLEPERILGGSARPDLDLDGLRAEIAQLPCCSRDAEGERDGDPLNLVLVGETEDLLAALARGGWSFTHRIDPRTIWRLVGATLSGNPYPVAPVSPLYAFGRAQDLALQRARSTILQRNHLRLWLAPFRLEGKSVWIGQVSRDVGIKATVLSPTLTTHVIDPNVDEAREHLLQSLLVAGVVRRFGFTAGIPPATPDNPAFNLTGDPYYTDGLRLFAQLSARMDTPADEANFLDWQESEAPLAPVRNPPRAHTVPP